MFSIRSKLVSLLQPWLEAEPDLELKLGFLRSHGAAKNLRFDNSALNKLIPNSVNLSCEEVRVDNVNVRFSPWSFPAFTLEFSGIYVKLSIREPVESGHRSKMDWVNLAEKEKKIILSAIDPEGTELHDVIENIATVTTSRHWLVTSLLSVILTHCRLLVHDIHLELPLHVTKDTTASSLKLRELSLGALHLEHTCLLKGVIRDIFMPQRVCSLILNTGLLEIGFKRKEHVNRIFFLDDFSACMKLKDLHLHDLDVCVPKLSIACTPEDLSILKAFDMLIFKEVKCARNGRELWNIAASRIDSLTSSPKLSIHKLVLIVKMWLCYVHSYESLLSLLGYPAEAIFEESSSRMSVNRKFSVHVKNQLKVVSKMEKDLPVEVLARARRVARRRAALCDKYTDSSSQPHFEVNKFILSKICIFLVRTVCLYFQSVMHFFFVGGIMNWNSGVERISRVVSGDSYSHYSFMFRKVLITVKSSATSSTKSRKSESLDIIHLDLLVLCATLDALFLIYTFGNSSKSLSLSCGDLNVSSSPVALPPMGRNSRDERKRPFSRKGKEKSIYPKTILWGEPAPKSGITKKVVTDSVNSCGNDSSLHLEGCLQELWLNWERVHEKFEGSRGQDFENPFLLCEIKSSLMDKCLDRPDIGIWKCNVSMGKLNVDLGYSSLVSIALLHRQVQQALDSNARNGRTAVLSQSPSIKVSEEITWEIFQDSYASGIKMAMFKVIPEKKVQIGIAINGPKFQISLEDSLHRAMENNVGSTLNQGKGDICAVFNLKNVEISVWPTSKARLSPVTEELKVDNAGSEQLRSNESSGEGLNAGFTYQGCIPLDSCVMINGLTVYLEDLEEKRQYQLIGLKSVVIHSSSRREYTHSFTTSNCSLSASLHGMIKGAIAISYMDEFELILKVVEFIISALSYAFTDLKLVSGVYPQEVIWGTREEPYELTQASKKSRSLILNCTQFVIDTSFELGSLDIIMHSSRKNHIVEYYREAYGASSDTMINGRDIPEFGIAVSVQSSHAQIIWDEGCLKTSIRLPGVRLVIFHHQSQIGEHHDLYELRNLLHQSPYCLYEFSVANFSFTLSASSHDQIISYTSGASTSIAVNGPPITNNRNKFDIQSRESDQKVRSTNSNLPPPSSGFQLLLSIAFGEILVAEYSLKSALIRANQQLKLFSSLCVGREHPTFSSTIEGGLIILETAALAIFIRHFGAYLLWIQDVASFLSPREKTSSRKTSEVVKTSQKPRRSDHLSKEPPLAPTSLSHLETCNPQYNRQLLDALKLSVSQFSVVLVTADGSGGVWELVLEVDFQLNIELMHSIKKLSFDLSRLTILSQHQHESSPEHIEELQILQFSPVANNELLPTTVPGDDSPGYQLTRNAPTVYSDEYSSNSPVPLEEYSTENDVTVHTDLVHGNYIMKHAAASILVEKAVSRNKVGRLWLDIDWTGSGSVSGLDVTVSLSEIEMVLSLIEPLSGDLSGVPEESKERYWEGDPGQDNGLEDTIPDGSVVAIQDLHEHTYFAVEGKGNKYCVVGTIHYSLVGERALFKVKHSNKKSWGSTASWFTLISLHAKSALGEPLRLNYNSALGYVDISSTSDDDSSLWRMLPCKTESDEADYDFESTTQASKNTFYFVNKKCNHSVAFVDGVPEFVKKPGNPLKIKLFSDDSLTHHVLSMDTHLEGNDGPELQHDTHEDEHQFSEEVDNLPFISITVDKIAVTVVHELPHSKERFPLLKACIDNLQFIVQVLHSKSRLICTYTASMFYFDAQENFWREIVHPVEMCLFHRSRFEIQSSEPISNGVPIRLYFRIKQDYVGVDYINRSPGCSKEVSLCYIALRLVKELALLEVVTLSRLCVCVKNPYLGGAGLVSFLTFQVDVSITELSLDILLFVVGELKMAGPFAVRSSVIFANCCKIDNKTSLSLLCRLYDSQKATVAGNRSTSVFIRPAALQNPPENSPFLSVQLAALGDFTTSPIHVSLLNARLLAWRTRVISSQGSRTSPGPFVVVDVSKRTKDGLSVVVSPLLKIHNETGLSMEIRFCRPQQKEAESASVLLRDGDTIDDSMAALNAINLKGGSKKVLMSLILGNFLFSCRPEITEYSGNLGEPISAEWSEDLKGGKAVCLSGIFDKLSYRFRKALSVGSVKISFSTVQCSLNVKGEHMSDLHFLILTMGKDIPVVQPDNFKDSPTRTTPVALQEQKEIFLLPTVQVLNHLQSEIHVSLTETNPDQSVTEGCNNIGKQATISCGSSAYLYANPAMIYFTVTVTAFNSSCKAVNSGDWVKKLQKKKVNANYLDITLEFDNGNFFASLRLSRSDRGILEAAIYTTYVLQNDSDLSLLCFPSDQKPLSRMELDKFDSGLPPNFGTFLPPKSTRSWFMKSNKMNIKSLEEEASKALLDLDVVSGFTELCLENLLGAGVRHIVKLGVSLKPWQTKMSVPSQIVLIVPRYIISNETEQKIFVRQCYLEDDVDGTVAIDGKQRTALHMKIMSSNKREISFFDSLFRKHKDANEDHLIYIQFRLNENGWSWSGPICVSSLGRFFVKFRRESDSLGKQSGPESKLTQFAVVHVLQDGSSLILQFDRPPDFRPPYRIENLLPNASVSYRQKDSVDSEILRSLNSAGYVWDDLSLPHRLVVQITGTNLSREINMDKMRKWKPFFKVRQQRGLVLELPMDKKPWNQEMLKVGYEVYADGLTRVLQISEFPGRGKQDAVFQLCAKFQLRVSNVAFHILENKKQEENVNDPSVYSPVVVARLANLNLDSVSTDQNKYNRIGIQSINVDEKWEGAPFAAMLRRNESDYSETNTNILQIVFVLLSTNSGVMKVKHASIILQPIQLNLDEETLMRFAPFWRTSLSQSNAPSRQFYFEHFEIHPIKVVASFLPGSSDSSYSSAQETLRSFLHNIIKIPAVKSKNVELNGILLTHALVTVRELSLKCAQHYSWYGMRAVYIAKGSPLLPPAFASIFDDSASSSLDIFFDPSSGLVNLPGITIGMFKFINKCINKKGFTGTKRYFGDLGKTVKTAGSNVLFAAITEISDSVLKGAEANGFKGMVSGFHHGILKLAMEPSVLGSAVMEGGADRKIKLDRSPGADELYIEGYLQAMLDTLYRQEYLRVRVIDNLVMLKNLPPSTSLLNEIMDQVKSFLQSKSLLQGDSSLSSRPLRHLRGEREWKLGPTMLTLWEHLFVSFAIRMLRKQALRFISEMKMKIKPENAMGPLLPPSPDEKPGIKLNLKWGIRKFVFSGVVAYIDGRLCRRIPNAVVRRIVSGFLLSLLDDGDDK